MTDNDDVLKELKTALQAEPSRQFAAGVRARVTQSQVRSRRAGWGLAAAAAVALATVALWRPPAGPSANDAPAQVALAPATVPAVPNRAPESVVAAPPATSAAAPAVTRREATVARASVATVESEPRLEVITNQRALLRELWAGVRTGAMVETVAEAAVPVPAVEVKPIAPIVLAPIVVPPIVVTDIGKGSGREGAAPVIRRVEATKESR